MPSNEVLNTPSKKTYCEERIASMETDSRRLHAVSASESDSEFLPSNVKPQFLHCTVLMDCTNSEAKSEGYSVSDHSMDTSDAESSMPSAKALSVALQTAILPFVHGESSPLTEDKTNDAVKCNPKQRKDTGDSNANNELVLDDSDSRTMEPESVDLIGTSHSKGIIGTNASVSDVHLLDWEVTTQTQQCDFEEQNKQGANDGNTLSRQTDGEDNDIIHAVRNSNILCVSPCITKEQHFVISVDAHESGVAVLEDDFISVDTNNPVNTKLEHEEAGFSENVRENNVIFVDGRRLVNENNDIRHKEQQKQLRNGGEHNEHDERSVETNNDSPLIALECFELGKIESCLNDQSRDNDEYVPCPKEVEKGVCDTSLSGEEGIHGVSSLFDGEAVFIKSNESFGIKCSTDEVEKYEGSSHLKVKSEHNVYDIELSGNLALHVCGMTQLQSERVKNAVHMETGNVDVAKSVRNDPSTTKQVPTQIETVSQLPLKTVEPLKVQTENYDRPGNDCEDTATFEIIQSVTHEGTELEECEPSSSTKVDDGSAETTSSFNLQGNDVSRSLQQLEAYPTLCANAEATCSKTIEMHFQSFSSCMELQTDSSSNSFISNIQDYRLWSNKGTNDAPMALDVAIESYSTLTGGVDDGDISQGLREHEVGGTRQLPSKHEILSEEEKRLDLTSATLENSVFGKHLKDSDSLSRENGAVSSGKQCSALELNSDNVLSKEEEVGLQTHLPSSNRVENDVSKEFGRYDKQLEQLSEKQQTSTSESKQNVTQLSEAGVSRVYSAQTKDDKPDDGELIKSQDSQCSSSSSHKSSAETFASLDSERDSNTSLCVVVNLLQSGNDVKDVSRTIGLNFSSEHPATKSSVKSEGEDFPEKNGAEATCDNVTAQEPTNVDLRVPMTNKTDESKRKEDDEKEEGEITSDEDDTSGTTKHVNKEREEGELSSSDSEVEASPQEKHGEANVPRSELGQNKSVFIRKGKELYPPRRHSLSEVPLRVSEQRSKVPENSISNRTACLPYFKKTDLRTKLSEARKTRSSLKGSPTFISGETRSDRPRETPVEKRVKRNSTVENPRQGKSVRDTTKTGNKAIVKSSRLQRASHGKRRETGQRSSGASNETKPGGSQRRDQTAESSLKFVKEKGEKCDNSLQRDDVKAKNASPITSGQKMRDRCDTAQVNPNKTCKDSTVSREAQGNRNTRKSRSDQGNVTKVKGKESIINLDTSQKARDCKGGNRKTTKNSRVVSRPKVKPNACPQDSQKEPLLVKKEKMRISTTAKLSLNEPDKHRKVESSQRPHSDNETTVKKACTHSESDNKKCQGGEKTNSTLLSSEGKAKNRPEKPSKATGERKTMGIKNNHTDKSKSKRVKTPVKASPRITPRKVLKKLPSNVTCKAKVQARHGERDKAGNTRKRSRAIDTTELRQAKKLRLEEGNDCSSKSPVDVSTIEKLQPSTKRGEYNNRENQPPSFKLEQEVIPPGGEKFKTANEEMRMDDPKTSSYNGTLSKTLLIGGNKRLVFKQRHVNQLFIRGDNVVMVAYAK